VHPDKLSNTRRKRSVKDGCRLRVKANKKAEHDGKPVADAKYNSKTLRFCFGGQFHLQMCCRHPRKKVRDNIRVSHSCQVPIQMSRIYLRHPKVTSGKHGSVMNLSENGHPHRLSRRGDRSLPDEGVHRG
jgi:uncharacterized ParB-like nuclease family protein